MTQELALKEALKIVGGGAAVAKRLGISPQAVCQWRVAPPGRVLMIERITEDPETGKPQVTRHDLRPDIFGPASESQEQEVA